MDFNFYPLTICYKAFETEDSVIIGLSIPTSLQETFNFKAGQNITIRKFLNGQEIRRSYSLCTEPKSGLFRIGIRAIPNGIFSNFALKELNIGDTLEVMAPTGSFIANEGFKENVFFAAGSGITPILSMIEYLLTHDQHAFITLMYGNRNIQSIMFRDRIDALKNKYLDRIQVIHILSRMNMDLELFTGRLNVDKAKVLIDKFVLDKNNAQYYLCGPEEMTLSIKEYLINEVKLDPRHVHSELFFIAESKSSSNVVNTDVKTDLTEVSKVTIRMDGKETRLDISYHGQSILDAGIEAGLDLPYSCKSGTCNTCKAQLKSGNVIMDRNFALEQDELEEGFILTCQSHPSVEEIYVDYDY